MVRKLVAMAFAIGLTAVLYGASAVTARAQGGVEVLPNEILTNIKLKKNKTYLIQGGVFVRNGATLKIKQGARIVADQGAFLVIDKGGKINAKGTATNPIVFTSAQPEGQRKRGDWGGLIFNGNAPVNCGSTAGGACSGEGGTGFYGGNNPTDNQGLMRYVRVEYGGFPISPDNELNCIAFQGVGSGTVIEYVEALNGGDDGFEWFGGTVNGKHLVSVGSSDDSFDFTFGWRGKVQFGLIQQRADGPSIADRGFEGDNNEFNFELTPRSAPQWANVTVIGDPNATFEGSTQGMEMRRGVSGQFRNIIVMGFKREGLRITDDSTYQQFNGGGLDFQGFIFFNNRGGDNITGTTETALTGKGLSTLKILDQIDPRLANAFSQSAPDFRPQAGSPALDAANVAPKFNDAFFETANYVGAFDGTNNWLEGWASFATN